MKYMIACLMILVAISDAGRSESTASGLTDMLVNPQNEYIVTAENGPQPADRPVSVLSSNTNFVFEVTDNADWLTVAPSSATTPATITLATDISGLTEGEYNATVTLTSELADNSPQYVSVVLIVHPEGTIPGDFVRMGIDSIAAGTQNAEIPFFISRTCPEPLKLMAHSNGFVITSIGDVSWSYADHSISPYMMMVWFNLGGGLFTNDIDGTSPDYFLIGGAAMPPSGMPVIDEVWFFNLYLDIGPGEGELCIDSGFVFSAGAWKFSGLPCGWGGWPDRPLFIAKDSSDANHPICITIFEPECGDVNVDGTIDIDDVVYLVYYIFLGGPAPNPMEPADANCSGGVDIDDAVYLLYHIFSGGNGPCDPDGNGVPDC
jgi:hypothetical protein